jgi:uncharacterized protein DUF4304
MILEIKQIVQPYLRSIGYRGSFPHFRRGGDQSIELMTFQFDRNGGGFVIEIARCPSEGIVTPWGAHIAPDKTTAWDVHPDFRKRIKSGRGGGTDSWFRFDTDSEPKIAAEALNRLLEPDLWSGVELEPDGPIYGVKD